jgi:hypothetical protein
MTTFVIDAQVAIDLGEIDERSGLKVLDDI